MRTSMFALAGIVAAATGCGDDNNVPDAHVIDAAPPIDTPDPAVLALSPLTADFGSVQVGTTSNSMTFTVTNNGKGTSGTISATLMGSAASNFAIETNGCTTLAAAATCTVTVSFQPQDAGDKSATLAVSGTPGGSVSAALDGKGQAIGAVTITPSTNAFADTVVGQTSASSATFTVKNTGGTTTPTLSVGASGSNPNDFVKATDNCDGMTLAAQASCTFTVSFKPASPGVKNAIFTVSGTTNPATATVSGTGIKDATLAVTPTLQDFGTVVLGQSSNVVNFTVTNSGGVASGAITQTIGGADASSFTVSSSSCSGATVAAGATCTVGVKFTPATKGAKAATLQFTATPGGTFSATLQGFGNDIGNLSANPTTLTYANTTVGQASASQTVTITNTGGSPTSAISTSLAGNDPGQFQIVTGSNGCAGTVLAAGATCTVAITFNPTSGGAKSANLSLAAGTSATSVGLAGNGIPDAHLTIAPSSHDFGAIGTGSQSGFFSFTVTNDGGQVSGVPAASLGGANATQFILQSGCTTALNPGATCTVQVRFAPNINNSNASASVSVTATPGGTATAQLFGQAVPPADLSPSDTSVDFNNDLASFTHVTLIGDSVVKTVTLTNLGTEPTGTIAITKSGTNAADFAFTSNCTTLPMGMSCTITITFTPGATSTGLETASLLVVAAPGGNLSIALHGDVLPRLQITAPAANPFTFPATIINTSANVNQTVTFKNNEATAQPFALAALTDTTNFSASLPSCGATISAGGLCSTTVRFLPTTVGAKTTNVVGSISGGGANNTATEVLNGQGINSLTITASTQNGVTCNAAGDSCDFHNVAIGALSGTLTVTVQNPTGAPNANSISTTLSSSEYQILSDSCAGQILAGNGSCQIQIRLAPTGTPGLRPGTLTVTASPAGGSASLALTGNAVAGANVTVTNNDVQFGTIHSGDVGTQTITLTNTGGAPSGVITITPPTGAFAITAPTGTDCRSGTTILAPTGSAGNTCTVKLTYSPTGAVLSTTPVIETNSLSFAAAGFVGIPSSNLGVDLTGTKVSSITITAPAPIGNVAVGSTTQKTYVVVNASQHPVTVDTATIVGAPAETTIVANMCTTPIPVGSAGCAITVQFAPTAAGDYNRTLQVNSTTGIATSPVAAHANTAASLAWAPPGADLGSALAAAANGGSQLFTLTNSGETAATIAVAITDTTNYTLTTTCTTSLAAKGSCTATVKFTPPAGATAGNKHAVLHAGFGGVDASVDGTVVVTGNVLVTPATADFGTVSVGQASAPQTLTLQNSSAATQTLTITTTNTEFARLAGAAGGTCGATLAAGASCTVIVAFTPTTSGNRAGQISSGQGGYAAVEGIGRGNAHLLIQGSSDGNVVDCGAPCTGARAFGMVATGDSKSFTYIVTNDGDQTAAAIATSIDGNDPASFTRVSDTCNGTALVSHASCRTVVAFAPNAAAVGNKTAVLHFTSATADAPFTINLSGTGVLQAILGITPSASPQSAGTTDVDNAGNTVTFSIHNQGDVALSTGLVIKLSNSTDFDIVTAASNPCAQGQILAANGSAGDTCNVAVQFDPETFGNNLTTTLTVTGGAGPGVTTVSNVVTGNATSSIVVAPASQAFGSITHGAVGAEFPFTFTNNADNATGVLHTVLGGADAGSFSVTSDLCSGTTQAAGASCIVKVRFSPQTAGVKTATLSIGGGAGGTPVATLTGTSN